MQQLMKRNGWSLMGLAFAAALAGWAGWQGLPGNAQAETKAAPQTLLAEAGVDGRELFQRNWLPEDPRSPEGDGLGPMFNESSCAACHNQGGPGGAGPTSKNVELLTAFVAQPQMQMNLPMSGPGPAGFSGGIGFTGGTAFPSSGFGQPPIDRKAIVQELTAIHPDFAKSSSVVIHRFGTSAKHNEWRTNLLTQQAQMPQQFEATAFSNVDGGQVVAQTNFQLAQPVPDPGTEPAAVQPPIAVGSSENPLPATQPSQPTPISQPVPLNVNSFNSGQQQATFVVNTVNTGIPLVDEALQEMQRLQQEARKDLSSSMNRGRVVLLRSQRSTSALFGAGQIDAIPDEVIKAAANEKHDDFPRVSGRVHQLPDKKIGKFGWKAQKASLREFTLAACANELGLDVPEHAQPAVPYETHEKPKGHDMTANEADALVAFVRSLPAPIEETPNDKQAAKIIEQGKELFESVGCAVCHKKDMGDAKGIYSDLLLHDMGDQLQASGSYGSFFTPQEFDPNPGEAGPADQVDATGSPSDDPLAPPGGTTGFAPQPGATPGGSSGPPRQPGATRGGSSRQPRQPQAPSDITQDPSQQPQQAAEPKPPVAAASAGEWRTPPLWGIRDSAPYLHDGRAATLEQAIALHGGEGSDAAIRYFMMPANKRQRMVGFLKTLRAPEQHAAAK